MLRLFRALIIALLFLLISAIQTTPILAQSVTDIDKILKEAGSEKYRQEFCERRSGDQMNLETWYSGKCKVGDTLTDSFSGEGVGFSSIVFLDLAEKILGKSDPDKSIYNIIKEIKDFFDVNGVGMTPERTNQYLAEKRQEMANLNQGGLLSPVSQGIAILINNPPASTKNYIAYVSQNLQKHQIIPSAYAQGAGYGFTGLSPLLPIWKAVRNLAYIIFILIFILYGFMMMFRVNISAKTAITIQLALPKLIATLLMITFSYAIVGFMVDLMYLVFYGVLGLLYSQGLIITSNLTPPLVEAASGQFGLFISMITNFVASVPASAVGIINLVIGGPTWLSSIIAIPFSFSFGFIIFIILGIAILISYLKLFFKLLQSFLEVVIALIIAPIVLLANALPGNDTFGSWLRGIFANLSVFPITMLLLLFSYMLMVQPLLQPGPAFKVLEAFGGPTLDEIFGVKNLSSGGQFLQIPLVSSPLGGPSSDAMLALLGVGLLLMAAKYVDIVKDALKVPPFKYGAAIGEALKGGLKATTEIANKRSGPSVAKDVTSVLNKGAEYIK